MCGGDAAFYQITLTTFYFTKVFFLKRCQSNMLILKIPTRSTFGNNRNKNKIIVLSFVSQLTS